MSIEGFNLAPSVFVYPATIRLEGRKGTAERAHQSNVTRRIVKLQNGISFTKLQILKPLSLKRVM